MNERGLCFDCRGETLVGVLAQPGQARADIGVLIVVGGPQYRVGSHRQFVQLARALADAGYPTLRFDVRGMGDSGGEDVPHFESISPDIGAAVDTLMLECQGLRRVVLWGLCDGASASLLYLDETSDARVAGVVMVNPWVRSIGSQARTQVKHYYRDRLKQREFWMKLLSGRVASQAFLGFVRNVRTSIVAPAASIVGFQQRMLRGWQRSGVKTLLLMSGDDFTAREFEEYTARSVDWRPKLTDPAVQRVDLAGADHTFSQRTHRLAAEKATVEWLQDHFLPTDDARARGGEVHTEVRVA